MIEGALLFAGFTAILFAGFTAIAIVIMLIKGDREVKKINPDMSVMDAFKSEEMQVAKLRSKGYYREEGE